MRIVRSWSKPEGVPGLIARKQVDWSALQYGATIPLEFIEDFQLANGGVRIERGQSLPVVLIHNGIEYNAVLTNANRRVPSDTFQILWRGNFKDLLSEVFASSHNFLVQERAARTDGTGAVDVSEDKAEYIEFYQTEKPFQYRVEFVPAVWAEFRKYVSSSQLQFSYKLVLLKAMLQAVNADGMADIAVLEQFFRNYYLRRMESGLRPDAEGAVVSDINSLTIRALQQHILRNPFAAYEGAGWMFQSGDRIGFTPELWAAMTPVVRKELEQLVDERLEAYFKERVTGYSLHATLNEVLNSYLEARNQRFSGDARAYQVLTSHIPEAIAATGRVSLDKYKIVGSAGQGNWAAVPWVAIMDRQVTESTQSGFYVVYLFDSEMQAVYLALMVGVTELLSQFPGRAGLKLLRQEANAFRLDLDLKEFQWENPQLGQGRLARQYEAGIIAYKKYEKGQVPEDSILRDDLKNMLDLYQQAIDQRGESQVRPKEVAEIREPESPVGQLDEKEMLTRVHKIITARGFQCTFIDLANFYLSLKSKPFVILAGISGTGKSWLPRLFAEAISAQHRLISVRPDWNDGSDLLGYVDLTGTFRPGELTNIIVESSNNPDTPYLVILDEMNLARVEYYMSDLLSKMETRELKDGRVVTAPLFDAALFRQEGDLEEYSGLRLPDNLYLIGTVNMDETTHPFSKKVLDRANTIEFSQVHLKGYSHAAVTDAPRPIRLSNQQMCGKFVRLADTLEVDASFVDSVVDKLVAVNEVLGKVNLQVGYRVRDEIVIYMLHNRLLGLMQEDDAFDYQLSQKILPRIQGSSLAVRRVLMELLQYCGGISLSDANDDLLDRLLEYERGGAEMAPYPLSATKLATMLRRFEEDGFTSYWI